MLTTLTIDGRFNGPPGSGNGGYVCGLVADFIDGTAEVTLRTPPPLDIPLHVQKDENGQVKLLDGETLIAEGRPSMLELEAPSPPSLADARTAVKNYAGFEYHIFPTCFVCGPERPQTDGLHIYPGPVPGAGLVAAPWTPGNGYAKTSSRIHPRFIWAALDCPGAFAIMGPDPTPIVLGRLSTRIIQPVFIDKEYIVIGWNIGQEGRKHFAGTAVFTADGRLCALAKATWIALAGN